MILPKLIPVSDAAAKRPTILLLSDDLNAPSGIGTMSREIVFNTAHIFNWIQVASTINHPELGKKIDMSEAVNKEMGITDASVILYPYNNYGDSKIMRYILDVEKPDAILHFTDPRYWTWLYAMEYEIRCTYKVPIMYYSIWDDLPYPHWNISAYSSCDLLMAISKQTHIIHKKVLEHGGYDSIDLRKEKPTSKKKNGTSLLTYIPHGIDSTKFKQLTEADPEWAEYTNFRDGFIKKHNADYIIFWNNRNIRRKQPGDVILSYKLFCDSLPKELAKKCVLLLHTHPRDPNGTDLIAVKDAICPDYQIVFSVEKIHPIGLNYYYNMADVTLNIASNEGFGLSNAESIMAGTPVIANVTGGLQDQMRFLDDDGNEYFPDEVVTSNHMKRYQNHGVWCFPVFPSNRSLQGSLETPYIFDDRVQPEDVAQAMLYWYGVSRDERKRRGLMGRTWLIEKAKMESKTMANDIADAIKLCIETFEPKPKIQMIKIEPKKKIEQIGIA